MNRKIVAGLLSLGMIVSVPLVAQNTAETAATKDQLKKDQKADKSQAKADKAERKAISTKKYKKADKAQDKANVAADKAAAGPQN